MNTTIFYFSATGNSLAAARRIASELGDAELVPMSEALKDPKPVGSTRIGFVFPVIAFGMPRTVAEFARSFIPNPGQYTFAVTTCGGTPAGTLTELDRILRKNGGRLDAGFAVKAHDNCLIMEPENCMTWIMNRIRGGADPLPIEERIGEIVEVLRSRRSHGPETNSWAARVFGTAIHGLAMMGFKSADKRYWVEESCTRCGTCERICPRGNIRLGENGPVWNHDCQLCNACIHGCPHAAIQYEKVSVGKPRYHHPKVDVKDLIGSRA